MRLRGLSEQDAQLVAAVTEGRLGEALATDLTTLREQHNLLATLTSPKALRSVSAILTTAETLAKGEEPATEILDRLATWIRDIALTQLGVPPDRLTHPGHDAQLRTLAESADLDQLVDVLQEIDSFQRNATRNLNPQLMLEHVLLRLRDASLSV